jgi:4-hydroxybenzoate polyprenyltransferase
MEFGIWNLEFVAAWFQLIRWKNLLIIFFTQLLVWYYVILPAEPKVLYINNFLLLSVSTVLIAAAGYIINDYFDIKIDAINKPGRMVLGKTIPVRLAIIVHSILNIIALGLAAVVAYRAHHYEWLLLQLSCTLLLWFYSTHFKRQFIIGNVVVAMLTALTIMALWLYEPSVNGLSAWVICIYAYFAFMLTWMREIVKDMEDFIGDAEQGCMTMPIKWGLKRSAQFISGLGLFVVAPLVVVSVILFRCHFDFLSLYIVLFIASPSIIWAVFLIKKTNSNHYHRASAGLKIIMVLGIISLIVYHFQIF